MLELSEEEEINGSTERKHPRGFQMCLTLTSYVSSDTSTIYTIVNTINGNYFTRRLYRVQPPLILTKIPSYRPLVFGYLVFITINGYQQALKINLKFKIEIHNHAILS